jgi:hypothetical protein
MVHFADVLRVTITSNEPQDYCKDMPMRFSVTSKKLFTIVQVTFIAAAKAKSLRFSLIESMISTRHKCDSNNIAKSTQLGMHLAAHESLQS